MVGIRRWYHGTGVNSTDNTQTVLNLTQLDNRKSVQFVDVIQVLDIELTVVHGADI